MKKYLKLIPIILAWAFSIINTSGWGILHDTPTKTNIAICLWFLFVIATSRKRFNVLRGKGPLLIFTILSFILIPLLKTESWEGFTYLLTFPLVYCFSQQKITQKDMVLSGYVVATLGLFILYVYSRTEILSGWNDNQISMIGLFSYIYYTISLYGNLTGRKLIIGIVISLAYFSILTADTASRSSAIFLFLTFLFAYLPNLPRKIIDKKRFIAIALSVPLIIAATVVLFPNLSIFQYFQAWSLEQYGKTAFNGRDELWLETFHRLWKSYCLGEGTFLINHHNSAMAVLGVFGVVGYYCWYKIFYNILEPMKKYASENLTLGFIFSFFLIFWQQSFDLGFVSASPNMLPYVIIGLGLAHVKTLKHGNCKYSYSRL